MNYLLAILTHGDQATLDRTIHSFTDKVRPDPARVIVLADGSANIRASVRQGWSIRFDPQAQGFCGATRALWDWAVAAAESADVPFVFWLEHDFTFLRPLDLTDLAEPLLEEEGLCQMQLMRNAVSREEIAAGGLYESRPGEYTPKRTEPFPTGSAYDPDNDLRWLEHRSYFTTNPSLMRTAWMDKNRPPVTPECEGHFGIDLVRRGFTFGVWGSGEPWVDHIGVRTGFGY